VGDSTRRLSEAEEYCRAKKRKKSGKEEKLNRKRRHHRHLTPNDKYKYPTIFTMTDAFKPTLTGAEFVEKLKDAGFTERTIDALQEEDINSDAALKILSEPDIESLAEKNKLTIGQKRLLLEFANTLKPKKDRRDDDRGSSRSSGPPRGAKFQRTRSRSPLSDRRRHDGDRLNPEKSTCIGVFNLSSTTKESSVSDIFGRFGYVKDVKLVYDRMTGESRGFGFVYFADVETATKAKEGCAGLAIDGKTIRTEYSITKRAHSPTPGAYLGNSSRSKPRRPETEQRYESAYPPSAPFNDAFSDPYFRGAYGGPGGHGTHGGTGAHGGHAGPRHFY